MLRKRLNNEDINALKIYLEDYLFDIDDEAVDKREIVFKMAKELNNSINSLEVLNGMLLCAIEKTNDNEMILELEGLRIYVDEVVKEMESLNSD